MIAALDTHGAAKRTLGSLRLAESRGGLSFHRRYRGQPHRRPAEPARLHLYRHQIRGRELLSMAPKKASTRRARDGDELSRFGGGHDLTRSARETYGEWIGSRTPR